MTNRIDEFKLLASKLEEADRSNLPTLALWDAPFGPRLWKFINLSDECIQLLDDNNFLIKWGENDGDTWYLLDPFLLQHLQTSVSELESKKRHLDIAHYVSATLAELTNSVQDKQAPLELIQHIDGSPLKREDMSMIEGLLLLVDVPRLSAQTEDMAFAKIVVDYSKLWFEHLLAADEFWLSLSVAKSLKTALIRWGEDDIFLSMIERVISKWMKKEPERIGEIQSHMYTALGIEQETESNFKSNDVTLGENDNKISPEKLIENGLAEFHQENMSEAVNWISKAASIFQETSDFEGMAIAYYHLSDIYFHWRKTDDALENNYLAEELIRPNKNKGLEAEILMLRGRIFVADNKISLAHPQLQNSLSIFEEINHRKKISECHLLIGAALFMDGNYEKSEEHLGIALAMARTQNFVQQEIKALETLSVLHKLMGKIDIAQKEMDQAISLREA